MSVGKKEIIIGINFNNYQKELIKKAINKYNINVEVVYYNDIKDLYDDIVEKYHLSTIPTNVVLQNFTSFKDIKYSLPETLMANAKLLGFTKSGKYIHIVSKKEKNVHILEDLEKIDRDKICCGKENSQTYVDAQNILRTISSKGCNSCTIEGQSNKLTSGEIDAFFVTGDYQCRHVIKFAKEGDMVLISIPDKNAFEIKKTYLTYERGIINLFDYTGEEEDQNKKIETLVKIYPIAVYADSTKKNNELIEQITIALYDSLPKLHKDFIVYYWPQIKQDIIPRSPISLHTTSSKFYHEEFEKNYIALSKNDKSKTKPWYKKWQWWTLIAAAIVTGVAASSASRGGGGGDDDDDSYSDGGGGGGGGCSIFSGGNDNVNLSDIVNVLILFFPLFILGIKRRRKITVYDEECPCIEEG